MHIVAEAEGEAVRRSFSPLIGLSIFAVGRLFQNKRSLLCTFAINDERADTISSIHSTFSSYLQSCFTRHDIQTTAAVFYLTSSGRSARSSLYSGQAGVSGFWCHRLERPASSRRICAVTRGFQTTT